jgi:transcription elongation factor Elf1
MYLLNLMNKFLYSTKPVRLTIKQNRLIRNHIFKYDLLVLAFACPHCGHSIAINKARLYKIFPLRGGFPAIICTRCHQYIYLSLKSNNPVVNQLKLDL